MKIRIAMLALFSFLFLRGAFADDTLSIKFMPMHVGDMWVYNAYSSGLSDGITFTVKLSVTCSRNINNHVYYYLNISAGHLFQGYYRMDSLTGSLYRFDSINSCPKYYCEVLVDSFAVNIGDSIRECYAGNFICASKTGVTIFNDTTVKYGFISNTSGYNWINHNEKYYTRKYGVTEYSNWVVFPGGSGSSSTTLKGCRINGIVYGDTSMTNSILISAEIPDKYELGQNYPNPFNQSSIIDFKLQMKSSIAIKVFDAAGKEVQTLVNETLAPGIYRVRFDGSGLSSGIYYYRLTVNNEPLAVKKMVLIK